jgi:transducin (beta)-like 1
VYELIKPDYKPARSSSADINGNGVDEKMKHKLLLAKRHVNGDAMDVDENGYGISAAVSEVESPVPISHAVQALDTLTIGASRIVSTEKIHDLFPDSEILDWREGSSISHSLWSGQDSSSLLIAGSNHVTTYSVDESLELIQSLDLETPLSSFDVRSLCLLGQHAFAVSIVENADGQEEHRSALVLYKNWGSQSTELTTANSGIIFALRYNAAAKLLITLSRDDNPLISLYRYSGDFLDPVASQIPLNRDLYDVVWMDASRFVVCGTNTFQIFQIDDEVIRNIQTIDMKRSWFQLKYDPVCDIIALVDEEMKVLRQFNVNTEDMKTQAFDEPLSDFDFQPMPGQELPPGAPRLLATSTRDGTVQLWDVLRPFTCVRKLSLPGADVAMKLSFSPDGALLAAAGYDTVAIWDLDSDGAQPKAVWRCTDQEVWRSAPEETEREWRSEPEEMEREWLHSLSWDMDGTKLVYSLDDQVSLRNIRMDLLT